MKNRKGKSSESAADASTAKEEPTKASIKSKINSATNNNAKKPGSSEQNKLLLIPITVIIGVLISWFYNNWLAGLVNTPLNESKIINESSYTSPENLDRFWGTYRPNLYFGLKTRSSNPLSVGMMWFNQFNQQFNMRHWCDQNDGLAKYGWVSHDGRNFGIHDIYENDQNAFSIRSLWVKRNGGKHGGDWTVRTIVSPFGNENNAAFVSIIFYFATDNTGWIRSTKKTSDYVLFTGENSDVGKFKIKIEPVKKENQKLVTIDQANGNATLVELKEALMRNHLQRKKLKSTSNLNEYIGFRGDSAQSIEDSNYIAFQLSGFIPFEFDVIFESDSLREELEQKNLPLPAELKGSEFDSALASWHGNFAIKFEETFKLRARNLSSSAIIMAQAALSNLLGGIGFFSGQSIVKSLNNKEPVLYWPSNLYTAVPSRSFFPRGFLWDEGFHNILISQWDLEITKDIIGHWLDLMNVEGWIPREVILGDEARAKVPMEFWIQNNQYANPPTLFLPLSKVIHRVNESISSSGKVSSDDHDVVYLNRIFKRLSHWYNWFNNTQVGKIPFTYRWRGRVSDSKLELNPKTLTSGLDDYPRASHPNDQERHLDLRCWIALASKVMGDLSEIVSHAETDNSKSYKTHYETLKDNRILDELHWSETQYADWGLHSDRIKLIRQKPTDERTPPNSMPMFRLVEVEPTYQFINSVGYVSLFPMLLELIDPQSPKLGIVLDQIRDPKHLWTNFGLRSLSKQAPLYDKRNTEHDPPYWRGAIWININYLTLKSLKHYSTVDGPHKEKAAKIYDELRSAVINNIVKNYEYTGYIWEQYSAIDGRGKGSHPFTGWSSLVVLIMAEIY